MPIPAAAIVGAQAIGGITAAKSARKAAHQVQRGIQQGQIAVQGGVDQSLAYLNAPVDTSINMNRPYSDSGIGAMGNVNAMLGIPQGQGTDVTEYEKQLSKMKKRKDNLKSESAEIKELIEGKGGWNTGGYRVGGKYKGMHRDQLTNKLAAMSEKMSTLDTEYNGVQRTYKEAQRQNGILGAASQSAEASGVQAIRPFEFNGSNFNEDPSYQFRLNEGMEALDRRYAARGGLGGGERMVGITNYAQNAASQEYQSAFDRSLNQWRSQFDVLNANLSAAGMGQRASEFNSGILNNAAGNSANVVMQGAGLKAGLYGASGNAAAAGTMGKSNAMQQMLGQVGYIGGQAGWFDNDSTGSASQPVSYNPTNDQYGTLQE